MFDIINMDVVPGWWNNRSVWAMERIEALTKRNRNRVSRQMGKIIRTHTNCSSLFQSCSIKKPVDVRTERLLNWHKIRNQNVDRCKNETSDRECNLWCVKSPMLYLKNRQYLPLGPGRHLLNWNKIGKHNIDRHQDENHDPVSTYDVP